MVFSADKVKSSTPIYLRGLQASSHAVGPEKWPEFLIDYWVGLSYTSSYFVPPLFTPG